MLSEGESVLIDWKSVLFQWILCILVLIVFWFFSSWMSGILQSITWAVECWKAAVGALIHTERGCNKAKFLLPTGILRSELGGKWGCSWLPFFCWWGLNSMCSTSQKGSWISKQDSTHGAFCLCPSPVPGEDTEEMSGALFLTPPVKCRGLENLR